MKSHLLASALLFALVPVVFAQEKSMRITGTVVSNTNLSTGFGSVTPGMTAIWVSRLTAQPCFFGTPACTECYAEFGGSYSLEVGPVSKSESSPFLPRIVEASNDCVGVDRLELEQALPESGNVIFVEITDATGTLLTSSSLDTQSGLFTPSDWTSATWSISKSSGGTMDIAVDSVELFDPPCVTLATATPSPNNTSANLGGFDVRPPHQGNQWINQIIGGFGSPNAFVGAVAYAHSANVQMPFGTLLVDVTNPPLFSLGPVINFGTPVYLIGHVSDDPALCGRAFSMQAYRLTNGAIELFNGWDLVIGL